MTRLLAAALTLPLVAATACGGGPSGPSPLTGATVAGTIYIQGGAAKGIQAISGSPAAGLKVTVVGTNLSATVESSGYFQITGVPSGTVKLQLSDATVNATTEIANVGSQQLVSVEIEVSGTTATVVSEERSTSKVSLCHSTGNGSYHMITVSDSAEPAHRDHGDAKPGEAVPGNTTQMFDDSCRVTGPAIQIEKSTNGQDADSAPGPNIIVGSPVTWEYVVTNTGTVALSNVMVTDDRGVAVTCPGTTLAANQSMTCTGSGVAVRGQYSNIGTVTATSPTGTTVTDSDPSHYMGRDPEEDEEEGPKVQLCHRTGNGSYRLLSVAVDAEPAHRAHGDAKPGEAVPNQAGKVFSASCQVQ